MDRKISASANHAFEPAGLRGMLKRFGIFESALVAVFLLFLSLLFLHVELTERQWRKWADSYQATTGLRAAIVACLETNGRQTDRCDSFEKLHSVGFYLDDKQLPNVNVTFVPRSDHSIRYLLTGKVGNDACELAVTRRTNSENSEWEPRVAGGYIGPSMGDFIRTGHAFQRMPCNHTHLNFFPLMHEKLSNGMEWSVVCSGQKDGCYFVRVVQHADR